MMTCNQCGKHKANEAFQLKHGQRIPTCKMCKDKAKQPERDPSLVPANSVSKLEGHYTPPTWHTRSGSDVAYKIRSLGI